jgi:hypothetical protein
MTRTWWSLVLLVAVALGTAQLSAGESGPPWTLEQLNQRLGTDNALTADQKTKVEAVNASFAKKMEEANKKEGVAAAQAAFDKAREGTDRGAIIAAYNKLNEARGFNAIEEYKKVLTPVLNEAQAAKLFSSRPGGSVDKKQ